ncbi:MAG TPA: sugar ABC transporter ATP-binding protein [Solirubrobacterales bacterium]|nr:sugar ABC transporter ATP-binding protein [Solirubrobacterales bacterium]
MTPVKNASDPAGAANATGRGIAVQGLNKRYSAVVALADVSLDFAPGEITGIVGKNGAGKSTLIKVLSGAVRPDSGTILVDGHPVSLSQPSDALHRGILTMHQQLETFGGLTVAENLLLGTPQFPRGAGGIVRWRMLWKRAAAVLEKLRVEIDPRASMDGLSVADRRMVTLARALVDDEGRMVILDEPTESLTAAEAEHLFERMRELRDRGICVIYVSHRLEEISAMSDRIVAMRDGKVIADGATAEFDRSRLVGLIAGPAEAQPSPQARPASERKPLVQAEELQGPGVEPSSFTLREGEIVGLCGLAGSGRSALARLLAGATRAEGGELRIGEEAHSFGGPHDAILAGVVFVPEDRRQQALFPTFTLEEDVVAGSLERLRWGRTPFLSRRAQKRAAAEAIADFNIAASGGEQLTQTLSGGNQQKVVLARWLSTGGRVLVLDEPTQGIDVGTRAEISTQVRAAVEDGGCALWISSDFEEILTVSDRLLIMREHKIVAELSPKGLSQAELLSACLSEEPQPSEARAAANG